MFCALKTRILATPLWLHATLTGISFVAFQGTRLFLDMLYAASGHPVDFATGQLAFDGEVTFGYYEAMRRAGTFDIYVKTQLFDFAFIASVICFGICFGTLLARMGKPRSATFMLGVGAAFFATTGATFDAIENLMSFVLMQFEVTIPGLLALIYSGFAALKFISLTIAMALAVAALLTGLITVALGKLRAPKTV